MAEKLLIETLVPPGVAVAELREFPPGLRAHPAEEHLIAKAVDKRRQDFIGARHCARQALRQLGEPEVAIGKGERGAPIWPRGIVGSLTHCDGFRGAVVGHRLRFRSLGIDAEPHEALPEGVLDSVSLPAERDWLARNPGRLHLDRVLFCAKEATYKAWFPLTGRWLGFEEAYITIEIAHADLEQAEGSFHSRLLVPGNTQDGGAPLTGFTGKWRVTEGLILTAIVHGE